MSGDHDLLQGEVKRLRESYRLLLPKRLERVQREWADLIRSAWTTADWDALFREVHSIAGTAGSFGFPRLGRTALELDRLIAPLWKDGQRPADDAALAALGLLIRDLREDSHTDEDSIDPRILELGIDESPSGTVGDGRRIFLVEDDPHLSAYVAFQMEQFGYKVRTFGGVGGLVEAVQRDPPSALVMDMVLPEGTDAGVQVVAELRKTEAGAIPVVFVSARADMPARLQAVRAGARAYFTKPLDIHALIDTLDSLTTTAPPDPLRVLLAIRNAPRAVRVARDLDEGGVHSRVVGDPMQMLSLLIDFKPDLILVGDDLQGCSASELAEVIAQDRVFSDRTVVFLDTQDPPGGAPAGIPLGGDVVRYFRGHEREMVAAVRARAERARALRSLLVRDSLTGLLTHTRTKERLSAELERARRYGGSLAFAMVDIDHFKQVNDQHGHQVGDRVIKSLSRLLTERLRRSDIVGRYGGEEFAVILTEASAEQAREVMDQVRLAFQQIAFTARRGDSFHCAFSCGVAQFPGFDDVDSLTHAADDAMYEAKRAGRNRVVVRAAGRPPAASSGAQGPNAPAGLPGKD